MPEVSRFYGIVITMYWNDHPPPHFHAQYGDEHATLVLDTLAIDEGFLRPHALRLVREWARQHQDELRENWRRARRPAALLPIEPLK